MYIHFDIIHMTPDDINSKYAVYTLSLIWNFKTTLMVFHILHLCTVVYDNVLYIAYQLWFICYVYIYFPTKLYPVPVYLSGLLSCCSAKLFYSISSVFDLVSTCLSSFMLDGVQLQSWLIVLIITFLSFYVFPRFLWPPEEINKHICYSDLLYVTVWFLSNDAGR